MKINYLKNKNHSCGYINNFVDKIISLNKRAVDKVDLIEIEKAILYAEINHANQIRLSGEPYLSHPIEVANITAEYMFDTKAIVAALLHDVVEDTNTSISQIKFIFGIQVAEIVNTVTKINYNYKLSEEETIYKINISRDLEKKATTIKVIDRLHNMRTIQYIKSIEKQRKIANGTLQFYVPLAKYANMPLIAQELQEIAGKVLNF